MNLYSYRLIVESIGNQNTKVTFHASDFIRITGYAVDLVRFDIAFIYELLPRDRRLFLLVIDVHTQEELDKVIDVIQLKLQKSWRVIGLLAVTPERVYIVAKTGRMRRFNVDDATHKFENSEDGRDDERNGKEDIGLLYCP